MLLGVTDPTNSRCLTTMGGVRWGSSYKVFTLVGRLKTPSHLSPISSIIAQWIHQLRITLPRHRPPSLVSRWMRGNVQISYKIIFWNYTNDPRLVSDKLRLISFPENAIGAVRTGKDLPARTACKFTHEHPLYSNCRIVAQRNPSLWSITSLV